MGRRRSSQAAFSLFAFQDIITSVTGIIILITLILAIELINRVQATPMVQTQEQKENIEQVIAELKGQIANAREQVQQQTAEMAELPTYDPEILKQLLREAKSAVAKSRSETEKQERVAGAKQTQAERMKSNPIAIDAKKKLGKLKKDNVEQERKLKELDSSDRVLFTSGVKNKTVWVVEITGRQIRAAKIGVSVPPKQFTSVPELIRWANQKDSGKTAFYLIVKPNGVESFRCIRPDLSSRFTIGYSLADQARKIIDDKVGVGKP